jgi:formate dehydrogenase assembly factor FdhD
MTDAVRRRALAIPLVRESVGRHNALDKLTGAIHAAGAEWDGGFARLSSRCLSEAGGRSKTVPSSMA